MLTFSNEAAQELNYRITLAFGAEVAAAMTVTTFHGFGVTLLYHHGHLVGYGTDYTILDGDAQLELVTAVLGQAPCDRLLTLRDPGETAERVTRHINFCKNRLHNCDALASELEAWRPDGDDAGERADALDFVGLFRAYEAAKVRGKRVDFADLISLPLRILEQHPDVAAAYREKYPWVLVDEFQDVTRATSRLLRCLCGAENPPWVVGDARQAIYRFLGAAPENVRDFKSDFPGAVLFELEDNYRSAAPIVRAANELATLMERPDAALGDVRERWVARADHHPLGVAPIAIAEAASDYAERQGIAEQVRAWLATGDVEAGDIAILARRNLDVREIVLALAARDIRAVATGLLTADGSAGDLAAVATLVDAPGASVPRVMFALGADRFAPAVCNEAVRQALAAIRSRQALLVEQGSPAAELVSELAAISARLAGERHTADGFTMLAAFLFDASHYLRALLDRPASAERGMALVEVVSVLSLTVGYRVTHPDMSVREARLGFAERLRARLSDTTPVPLAPPARPDAVRVMTCHASKGFEFPCVIVTGQTLPKAKEPYLWLPPTWRPAASEELEQADALLFVGVTRGERAAVVSYPLRAGEGPRAPAKRTVELLDRWRTAGGVPALSWNATGATVPSVTMGMLWGGAPPAVVKSSVLDESACPLFTYFDEFLDVSFPVATEALYPRFFAITRRILRELIAEAHRLGRALERSEAEALVASAWPETEFAGHPHGRLYRDRARGMVLALAEVYVPDPGTIELLEPECTVASDGGAPAAKLDLIGHFRKADGQTVAISFRPESFEAAKDGKLNWSALSKAKRAAFVLLEHQSPGTRPYVFSGGDGRLYEFQWRRNDKAAAVAEAAATLLSQRELLAKGEFSTTISAYHCDGCRARVSCPYWVGATTA